MSSCFRTYVPLLQSGAPHYYIIASGHIPKYEIAERWYRIVGPEDEKHLRTGTRIEAIKSKGH
jgi:hypothetical protein